MNFVSSCCFACVVAIPTFQRLFILAPSIQSEKALHRRHDSNLQLPAARHHIRLLRLLLYICIYASLFGFALFNFLISFACCHAPLRALRHWNQERPWQRLVQQPRMQGGRKEGEAGAEGGSQAATQRGARRKAGRQTWTLPRRRCSWNRAATRSGQATTQRGA